MSENQNQREDFRRVNAAGRTLGIRIVAAGFAVGLACSLLVLHPATSLYLFRFLLF